MDYNTLLPHINYPQEPVEGEKNAYQCVYCKRSTLEIAGRIENHAIDCQYRKENTYFELED